MDTTGGILTFQAPARETPRVACAPSPTLELAYAAYYLIARASSGRGSPADVAWIAPLLEDDPDLVAALQGFPADHDVGDVGIPLLVLAARYDFVHDPSPERFLRELPALPARYLAEDMPPPRDDADGTKGRQHAAFLATVGRLATAGAGERLRDLLTRFWEQLEGPWLQEGRLVVAEAVAEFERAFARTGAVLEALPPHHFTRFEHLARTIREAEATERVVVVPLYFAAAGGFAFDTGERHFVGYGLQSERVFERTAREVEALATRAKALADPSRLMVLTLVGRFASFKMTVGDLATHIGVSQPTLSGHLKLLRDAGLVGVERQGTRSFYSLDRDALRQLLQDLEHSLLD